MQTVKARPTFHVAFIVAILFIFYVFFAFQLALVPLAKPPTDASEFGRQNPEVFRLFSFGQLPAAIDLTWLSMIQHSGEAKAEKWPPGKHSRVYFDLDVLTELDPAFFEAYTTGADLLAVVINDSEGALALLSKGDVFMKEKLERYPDFFREKYWDQTWRLSMLLGYVYLFELNDMPHAAIAFREAGEHPRSPLYLRTMADRLSRPGGEYEVGLRLLNFMIAGSRDDSAKERLEMRRQALFVSQFVFHLNYDFQEFLKGIADYRARKTVPLAVMKKFFEQFLKRSATSSRDAWGGSLYLDSNGKIATSTPHEKVFDLD